MLGRGAESVSPSYPSSVSEDNTIQVNFGKPIPVFPLDTVTLLPQQVLPLHIFEPRYRQMVEHALDASGQIAMGVFDGPDWKQQYHGRPPIRPAVCVGHIVQHEKLADGRFNIILQGVCRARIVSESPPTQTRLYREAMLEPVGVEAMELPLDEVRSRLEAVLSTGPLAGHRSAEQVLEHVRNEEVPTHALLELVSFFFVQPQKLRYRLLAEGDVLERAELILGELGHLAELVRKARGQHPEAWPKGCSWN